MIKYLKRRDINTNEWDTFISSTPQRVIYALSYFLDTIPQEWGAIIQYDIKGKIVAAIPFQIKKKFGITKIEQDPFTPELGVFHLEHIDPKNIIDYFESKFRFISKYTYNASNNFNTKYEIRNTKYYTLISGQTL